MTKVVSSSFKPVSRPWITTIITGILAVALGAYMILQRENFIQLLVMGFGVYVFLTGLFAIIAAFRISDDRRRRRTILIRGLLNMIVGGVAVSLPFLFAQVTWTIMLYLVAVQLVIASVLEFLVAFRLRQAKLPMGPALFGGFISLAFAILLFSAPEFIGLTLIWVVGAVILTFGLMTIWFGWRMRRLM
ncbi:MAG: DUF308 domain-containing protein [Chloroflexota bacterium]